MRQLKTIIFDVDGTLAETEAVGHRVAFNQAFKDMGLGWEWDEALYGELLKIGGGRERLRHYIDHYVDAPRAVYDQAFMKRVHQIKSAHYARLVERGQIPLRPGIAALIADAHASNITLAIASSASAEGVHALIKPHFGERVAELFKVIGAGDVVANKKPSPDIYRWVLARLALEAGDCIVIEDSHIGLKAATDAGLRTIATPTAYTVDQDFSLAAHVLPASLSECSPEFAANMENDSVLTLNLVRKIFEA